MGSRGEEVTGVLVLKSNCVLCQLSTLMDLLLPPSASFPSTEPSLPTAVSAPLLHTTLFIMVGSFDCVLGFGLLGILVLTGWVCMHRHETLQCVIV